MLVWHRHLLFIDKIEIHHAFANAYLYFIFIVIYRYLSSKMNLRKLNQYKLDRHKEINVRFNRAQVDTTLDQEVATLSPGIPPRIAHNPITYISWSDTPTDDRNGMIHCLAIAGCRSPDPKPINVNSQKLVYSSIKSKTVSQRFRAHYGIPQQVYVIFTAYEWVEFKAYA